MSLQDVLDALGGSRFVSGQWMARCPVHGEGGHDSDPSLAVRERDGRVLTYCHACRAPAAAVREALGLPWAAFFSDGAPARSELPQLGQTEGDRPTMPVPAGAPPVPDSLLRWCGSLPTHRWRYRDATGRLLFGVLRWAAPGVTKEGKPKKVIRQLWYFREHGWRWKGRPLVWPLYGLWRVARRPDDLVLICEGEKAADAAQRLVGEGIIVVGFRASAVQKTDWSPLLGRRAVVWPDNDRAGFQAAEWLARYYGAGVVDVPAGLPHKWDLADEFPDGLTRTHARTRMCARARLLLKVDPEKTHARTDLPKAGESGGRFRDHEGEVKGSVPVGNGRVIRVIA